VNKIILRCVAVAAAVVLAGSGCGSVIRNQAGRANQQIKIYYLQKQGTQSYFVQEAAGARTAAIQLGVDLVMVDLGKDGGTTVDTVNTAITNHADGIIIAVPDPAVGPQVVNAIKRVNIPLLTSDEPMCVSKPDPATCAPNEIVPRVGFNASQLGADLGTKAADLYRAAGWQPADTRIISVGNQELAACGIRVKAAAPAFATATGTDLPVLDVSTDNTTVGATVKVASAVAANPGVKHWIVWGCDDANVIGGIAALQNAGFGPNQVIGLGVNGDLACTVWTTGRPTGLRASLWLNGADVGAQAVKTMHGKIKNDTEFQHEAVVPGTFVTPDTYKAAGLTC
jgi:L-arabinose transport system substrate-binding protein